jgi:oligopeptide/dipeptide ABC transporter ATP-binding protein
MTLILSVRNLKKYYKTHHGMLRAVDDVSFDIDSGKTFALVGESGCGKSTVALALLRLIETDGGHVLYEGVEMDAISHVQQQRLQRNMSIVFQDPYSSLNPRMKILNIVGEPLKIAYGLRGNTLRERVTMSLKNVGMGSEHIGRYPHEFSGGQRQRIAIARALTLEPKLVILDEPTSALDVSVQAQVLNLLSDLQRRLKLAYLLISHDLATVESVSDYVMVMYLGKIVEAGPVECVFSKPRHPYTQALLDSIPSIDPCRRDQLKPLSGEIPSVLNLPGGCNFGPRCFRVKNKCKKTHPDLDQIDESRSVACYYPL